MRTWTLFLLFFLGLGGYAAYRVYTNEPVAQVTPPTPTPPTPAPSTFPAPSRTPETSGQPSASVAIDCPCCKTEGWLMYRSGASLKGGHKFEMRYACPVCGGSGGRTLTLPVDGKLCPDCHGMGRRLYGKKGFVSQVDEDEQMMARPCARCGGTGYILLSRRD